MEASSSTSSSLRRRAPFRCYCGEKPVLVVSWTPDNPGRRFYGCPNYWVFQYLSFFLINLFFFLLGSSSLVTVGWLLMLFCFIEMGFSSSSLFLVFFFFFQCLLFSEKTRENLGKLILNHRVFMFLFLFHWG